jgi:hypothetical protein
MNSITQTPYSSRIVAPRPRYPAVGITNSTIPGSLEEKKNWELASWLWPEDGATSSSGAAGVLRSSNSRFGQSRLRKTPHCNGLIVDRSKKEDGIKQTDLDRCPMLGNWQSLYDHAPPHCNRRGVDGTKHLGVELQRSGRGSSILSGRYRSYGSVTISH